MKKNKRFLFYTCITILVVLFSVLVEIFVFNRQVLKYNNIYSPKIIDKNISNSGKEFITTGDNNYIIIGDLKDNNYINRLKFDYKYTSNDDFSWKVITDNDKEIGQKSSRLINQANKDLNITSKTVKIIFKNKNIKISSIKIDNTIKINYSRLLFIIITIISTIILIINRRFFYKNLDKAFIFISVVLGSLLFIITPKVVGASLDDNTHLKKSIAFFNTESFKTDEGYLIAQSRKSVSAEKFTTVEEQRKLYKTINNHSKKIKVSLYDYSPKYSSLVYFPFKLGFVIGNILNLSFLFSCLLARIINYIVYVSLMFLAIKISSRFKRIVFVVALSLSSLYLSSQFSYDPTIIASLTLSFVLFVKMMEEKTINYKYYIAFILTTIWGCLPKAIYCPILLLALFIPTERFSSKKQATILRCALVLVFALIAATFVLPVLSGGMGGDIRGGNINLSQQLKYIVTNPFSYAITLFKFNVTSLLNFDFLLGLFMFVCNLQGAIASKASCLFLLYSVLVLYTIFTSRKSLEVFNIKCNLVVLIVVVILLAFIPTTMYLVYTPVTSPIIMGVQTRYYLPMLLPILFLLVPIYKKEKRVEYPLFDQIIIFAPYIINMVALYYIVSGGVGF